MRLLVFLILLIFQKNQWQQSPLSQGLLDGLLQALGLAGRRPPLENLAVLADEELLKVPLDALKAHEARLLRLEELEHGLGVVAVDLSLAEDRERDAVVELAELLDGVVVAGILTTELVAGEADNLKVVGVRGLDFCSTIK